MTAFMHFDIGPGRVTAAIRADDKEAEIGLAFCSPEDQFSRKRGRLIAEGRLNVGKSLRLFLDPDKRVKAQVMGWLREYLPTSQTVPWWVNSDNKHS